MGGVEDKAVVVLGGTSGIGAATAELLVKDGANVVIAGRRVEVGVTLAERLGPGASFLACDVQVEADVEALMTRARERLDRIDGLINCAGDAGTRGGITHLDLEGTKRTLDLHLGGTLAAMKHCAPIMLEQGSGSIVNVASIAGRMAGWTGISYSVAKAAVIHATRCAATELGEHGVRVNSVSPGPTLTGIFGKAAGLDSAIADREAPALEAVFTATLADWQPVRRAGVPTDVAPACVWLVSDASRFINGQDVIVDGGITAGRPASVSAAERKQIAEVLLGGSKPTEQATV